MSETTEANLGDMHEDIAKLVEGCDCKKFQPELVQVTADMIVRRIRAEGYRGGPVLMLREQIMGVLENVCREGLPGSRDLDVAVEAITCCIDDFGFEKDQGVA